jgi:hypothetical protein
LCCDCPVEAWPTCDRGSPGVYAGIPVGEHRPILCDAVDVQCPVAHHTLIVSADVEAPDVIAPDDKDAAA